MRRFYDHPLEEKKWIIVLKYKEKKALNNHNNSISKGFTERSFAREKRFERTVSKWKS